MSAETPPSWARLLADKGPTLANYFLRRVAHRWDAQDLVQEVYLRLLRSGDAGAGAVRNPEAYLFTVAANLVKEHAQMRQRAPISSEGLEDFIEKLATPCDAGRNQEVHRTAAVFVQAQIARGGGGAVTLL